MTRAEKQAKELIQYFEGFSDRGRAVQMKAYMRDQFEFLGISSPRRKVLAREFFEGNYPKDLDQLMTIVEILWRSDYREMQYVAMDLMERRLRIMGMHTLDTILDLIVRKSWWDTVDWLSPKGIGLACIDDMDTLKTKSAEWIQSPNFWLQRTALLYQLKLKDKTNALWLFELIRQSASSTEFFVRKAQGWALREYSKIDPKAVRKFLESGVELSSLTIREGSKYI